MLFPLQTQKVSCRLTANTAVTLHISVSQPEHLLGENVERRRDKRVLALSICHSACRIYKLHIENCT